MLRCRYIEKKPRYPRSLGIGNQSLFSLVLMHFPHPYSDPWSNPILTLIQRPAHAAVQGHPFPRSVGIRDRDPVFAPHSSRRRTSRQGRSRPGPTVDNWREVLWYSTLRTGITQEVFDISQSVGKSRRFPSPYLAMHMK